MWPTFPITGNRLDANANPGTYVFDGVRTPISRPRLGYVLGRQLVQKQRVTANVATAYTYHQTIAIETAATRFRLALHNSGPLDQTITAVAIGVSNGISGTVATDTTPSTATWVQVTFGGLTTFTLTAAIDSTAASVRPRIMWSDWIDISTIPRTDGGTLPIFHVRIARPANEQLCDSNYVMSHWVSGSAGFVAQGRVWRTYRGAGDGATVTAGAVGAVTFSSYSNPVLLGFEYEAKVPGITFVSCGDSIDEGAVNGSTGNFGNGWNWQVINLMRALRPDIPMEFVNIAVASSYSSSFLNRATDFIAAGSHFDIMTYSPFSPNGYDSGNVTPTQAVMDLHHRSFATAMRAVLAAGKGFIVRGPCPNDAAAWNAATDAFRKTYRDILLLSRNAGVGVIDMEVLSDGASPARFNPTSTTDGTHPNENGYSMVASMTARQAMMSYLPSKA